MKNKSKEINEYHSIFLYKYISEISVNSQVEYKVELEPGYFCKINDILEFIKNPNNEITIDDCFNYHYKKIGKIYSPSEIFMIIFENDTINEMKYAIKYDKEIEINSYNEINNNANFEKKIKFSNNSNNSTNSNEKNIKNNEINSNRSNSEIGSNNILSNKSDTTIKTEEVNKSNNTKSNNTDENKNNNKIKLDNNNDSNINASNINNNNSSSSDNNKISLNLDFMSSSNGKTISLEKLNNYLQDNKPVSNFSNPILSLNNSEQKNISQKAEENSNIKKNTNNNNNDIKNINDNNNNPSSQNNKNNFYPMNNYFNSMYNFLLIPNFLPNKNIQIPPKLQKLNNIKYKNNIDFKPNPIDFNKNVIDFNKLTLETKNKVHFMTHSSRNYLYKYVCNYTVQIENDNIFMVTKRIIGKNGCFLKKILQESCIKYGDYSTKIRLRGKGSGYVDKISNTESNDEPLTLSVSSLNYPTYYNCCLLVDNLMKKVYDDYFEYLHKVLPKELHYSIK